MPNNAQPKRTPASIARRKKNTTRANTDADYRHRTRVINPRNYGQEGSGSNADWQSGRPKAIPNGPSREDKKHWSPSGTSTKEDNNSYYTNKPGGPRPKAKVKRTPRPKVKTK